MRFRLSLATAIVALIAYSGVTARGPAAIEECATSQCSFMPLAQKAAEPTATPTEAPTATATPEAEQCAAEYPTVCIPPPPPDLNCTDIPFRRFTVLPPDRHHFDTDGDGIGCESN